MNHDAWSEIFADPLQRPSLDRDGKPMRFEASQQTIDLLSFQLIDEWIRYGRVRYPQFQVNGSTSGIPPNEFTVTRPYLTLSMPGYPDTDAIAGQLAKGATLRFLNIEDWYPPLAELCARLGALVNARTEAFAFYTPPSTAGVHRHWDTGDVFVMQVEGSKTWHLWNLPDDTEREAWGSSQHLKVKRDPDHVHTLRPGDGLYLPVGTGHEAFAGPEASLHLSITVKPTTYRDVVLAWAENHAASLSPFARLPMEGDRTEPLDEILEEIATAARETDPAELVPRLAGQELRLSDTPLIPGVPPRPTSL